MLVTKLLINIYHVLNRFKTEAYDTVVNRFNERFLLSLADNPRCLVLDDALNVLPISSKTAQVQPVDSIPEVTCHIYLSQTITVFNKIQKRIKEWLFEVSMVLWHSNWYKHNDNFRTYTHLGKV